MAYIGTSINTSPTIAGSAAVNIENGGGKAVKYDANGKIVLCSVAGEKALGVLILQTNDDVKAGESVTVQVLGQGVAFAAASVKAGDVLTVDATGSLKAASSGESVIGMATSAAAVGSFVKFLIDRSIVVA